jgi:hypothetical protein|tara:strand:+ start:119 stop:334 length:216 start_codon:yes stop_codon:yes gene_type:complete
MFHEFKTKDGVIGINSTHIVHVRALYPPVREGEDFTLITLSTPLEEIGHGFLKTVEVQENYDAVMNRIIVE